MLLHAKNLEFAYDRRKLLNKISLQVRKGDSLCLLGANGAGKTTLLRCLLGMNKISSGEILLNGIDLRTMSAKEIAKEIAYVPQATNAVFPYSVLDMVVMGRNPHISWMSTPSRQDREIAEDSLQLLEIEHLAAKSFHEISGGERQMVLIARAIAQKSNLLIMDEPTASLDYGNQVRILTTINDLVQKGYTIIMTSHFPNHAFLVSNRVALLKGGVISEVGGPDDIITERNLSQLYQARIKVVSVATSEQTGPNVKVCIPLLGGNGVPTPVSANASDSA